MLSHANAFTLPRLVRPRPSTCAADDRFASHAPFHFDLSVFDLFASCRHGGDAGPDRRGARQGPGAARARSWPSGGSASGTRRRRSWRSGAVRRARPTGLPAPPGSSCSRARSSRSRPCGGSGRSGRRPTLWNLYGPTETNVCTAYRDPRRRSPTTAPTRSRSARSARRCGRGWWTSRARDVAAGDRRRAGHRRPGRDARLLRPARADRQRLPPRRRRHPLVPHRRPRRRRRRPAASPSTAAATGWSRSGATGSSWARSSRRSTATRASTAPRWSPSADDAGVSIAAFVAMKPGAQGLDHRHEAALHASTCRTTWCPTRSRSCRTCRRPRPTRSITRG